MPLIRGLALSGRDGRTSPRTEIGRPGAVGPKLHGSVHTERWLIGGEIYPRARSQRSINGTRDRHLPVSSTISRRRRSERRIASFGGGCVSNQLAFTPPVPVPH
jgi:hypothetical protein